MNCPRCGIGDQEVLIVPRIRLWIPGLFKLEVGTVNLSKRLGIKKFTFFETIPLSISNKDLEAIARKLGLKLSLSAVGDIHASDIGDAWVCFNCGHYKFKGQLFGEK